MASLVFAAETSAEFERVKRGVFQNPLLMGLISEFTQKSFVLDATCKAMKEVRYGVAQYCLSRHYAKEYLGDVLFNRMINRRMNPSRQLILKLEYNRSDSDSPRHFEEIDLIGDAELSSRTAPLLAEARRVRLELEQASVEDILNQTDMKLDTVTTLVLKLEFEMRLKPFVNVMKNLLSVSITDVETPVDLGLLRGLDRLVYLKLDAAGDYLVKGTPGSLGLKSLETLMLDEMPDGRENIFGPLPNLSTLKVETMTQSSVELISHFPTLKTLIVNNFEDVRDLSAFGGLTRLEILEIPVEGVPPLPGNFRVSDLGIEWSDTGAKLFTDEDAKVKMGRKLAGIQNCVSLSLYSFPESALSILKDVKDLKKLRLTGYFGSLDFLKQFQALENLEILGFKGSDVSPIGNCKMLKRVALWKKNKNVAEVGENIRNLLPNITIHFEG